MKRTNDEEEEEEEESVADDSFRVQSAYLWFYFESNLQEAARLGLSLHSWLHLLALPCGDTAGPQTAEDNTEETRRRRKRSSCLPSPHVSYTQIAGFCQEVFKPGR